MHRNVDIEDCRHEPSSFPEINDSRNEFFDSGDPGRPRKQTEWLIVDANGHVYGDYRAVSEREAAEDIKAFASHDVEAVLPLRPVREDRFDEDFEWPQHFAG
jgi:hypothetical protein